MQYYIVDAFSEKPFGGNPAGVCILQEPIEERLMQKIAMENNLSETAFLLKQGEGYRLRWFTPKDEIDLCGHATLAGAYVIRRFIDPAAKKIWFDTKSGVLTVTYSGGFFYMDFPARPLTPLTVTDTMAGALGAQPREAYLSRDYFFLFESEEQVINLKPDFRIMEQLQDGLGVIVTAKGKACDFVSRYFCPELGVKEDPVTGSSHCNLIPFWSQRLHKDKMTAYQLSPRGGVLYCEMRGERVVIGGKASLYLSGKILED